MQSQNRYTNLSIKNNISLKIVQRRLLCLNPRSLFQPLQVIVQTQPSLRVERLHFVVIYRLLQLRSIVHAVIPRPIPARSFLQFRAEFKSKWKINLRQPQILIRLLRGIIRRRRLRRQWSKPPRSIPQRRRQRDPRLPFSRALRFAENLFGRVDILDRIGDIHQLQSRSRPKQHVESKRRVQRHIPRSHASRHHAAHGQRRIKPRRIPLHQPRRDHSPQRVSPRNRTYRRAYQSLERVQNFNLIRYRLLDRPARARIRRARQRIAMPQQIPARNRIAHILGRIRESRHLLFVSIQNHRPIPLRRNLNQITRPIRKLSFVGFDRRCLRQQNPEHQQRPNQRYCAQDGLPHGDLQEKNDGSE